MFMNFEKNQLRELKISGSGTSAGGNFDGVSINGSGNIYGDTKCNDFKISGSGGVEGNLKCKSGKISGSAKILGAVDSEEFKISGFLY